MIYGIGTDIASVARIDLALTRSGEPFKKRIFTENEIRHCDFQTDCHQSYAKMFASKEAVLKAYGMGWYATNWKNIEVVLQDQQRPRINLFGAMKRESEIRGISRMHLSVSVDNEYAVALLIMEVHENH